MIKTKEEVKKLAEKLIELEKLNPEKFTLVQDAVEGLINKKIKNI